MTKTIYKNMTIINGHKHVPAIEKGAIIVNLEGNIEYVGPISSMPNVPEADEIDLEGKFVMPGLINAHGHYFNSGKPINNFPPFLIKLVTWFLKTFIGKIVLHFIYKNSYTTAVNAGITTVRDMGSFYYNDIKYRDYFDNDNRIGPRIITSGSMITSTGGHGYEFPDRKVADNPWADRKAVREHILHQVDWIKICNTAGVSDARFIGEAGQPTMTVEEIEAACNEAHSRNFLVATHCESTEGIRRALAGGVDTIEHGAPIEDDMVPLFLDNPKSLRGYTSLVPTLSAFFIPDFAKKLKPTKANKIIIENTKITGDGCKQGLLTALKHGIHLGIGNDASVPRVTHYNLYQELLHFQKFGDLSTKEVIHIATVDTAKLVNVDKETGSLEAGKAADFIVLDKNPLNDLNNIYKPRHVVARGRAIMKPRFKIYKGI